MDIVTRQTIITCVEDAIINDNVLGMVEIKAIMASINGDIGNFDSIATFNHVRPVSTILNEVSVECQVLHA